MKILVCSLVFPGDKDVFTKVGDKGEELLQLTLLVQQLQFCRPQKPGSDNVFGIRRKLLPGYLSSAVFYNE